jgi:hypothetical protein
MTGPLIWAAWFAGIIVPGTIVEAALQVELHFPLGYSFAFILFVLGIAVAVAESQCFMFEASKEHDTVLEIFADDGDQILEDIDQELNG